MICDKHVQNVENKYEINNLLSIYITCTCKIVNYVLKAKWTHNFFEIRVCMWSSSRLIRGYCEAMWVHLWVPLSYLFTYFSLITWICPLMQILKEVINPHPRIAPHVNMWSVFFNRFDPPPRWKMVIHLDGFLRLLLLLPVVVLLVYGYTTLYGKVKQEVDMWRWIICYDTINFSVWELVLKPKP